MVPILVDDLMRKCHANHRNGLVMPNPKKGRSQVTN